MPGTALAVTGSGGVARAEPGAERPRPAPRVAMALPAGAPGRVPRARGGDAGPMRRQPGRRVRGAGAAVAGPAGGGAAAAGRPVSDAGLADRVARAAACPAGACGLVGRLAVGPW